MLSKKMETASKICFRLLVINMWWMAVFGPIALLLGVCQLFGASLESVLSLGGRPVESEQEIHAWIAITGAISLLGMSFAWLHATGRVVYRSKVPSKKPSLPSENLTSST